MRGYPNASGSGINLKLSLQLGSELSIDLNVDDLISASSSLIRLTVLLEGDQTILIHRRQPRKLEKNSNIFSKYDFFLVLSITIVEVVLEYNDDYPSAPLFINSLYSE